MNNKLLCVETLKTRPEFLLAASALRQGAAGFLLQARNRHDFEEKIKVGFTASKKIGNSVKRNLAKRRLRSAAYRLLPYYGWAGWDYVLVARPGASICVPFSVLEEDLKTALNKLHKGRV